MSKLDEILNGVLPLHTSKEIVKIDIKILMLELYKQAMLEETTYDMGQQYAKMVDSL